MPPCHSSKDLGIEMASPILTGETYKLKKSSSLFERR